MTETYLYVVNGQRICRQVAYVPFVFYEQAVSAGGSLVTRHYSVNGERVAVRVGGALYYLYHDQVGSTILATDAITNVAGSHPHWRAELARQCGWLRVAGFAAAISARRRSRRPHHQERPVQRLCPLS